MSSATSASAAAGDQKASKVALIAQMLSTVIGPAVR